MAMALARPMPCAAEVMIAVFSFSLSPMDFDPRLPPLCRRLPSVPARALSMTNDDLCYLSAAQALAAFRARELSPAELMQALVDRATAVNARINCFADSYFEEA